MKCLRRYFCVLLCCVLSLGVFSVSVSAADVDTKQYKMYQYHTYGGQEFGWFYFTTNNGEKETLEKEQGYKELPTGHYYNIIAVRNSDESPVVNGGRNVKATFNNVYFSLLYELYNTDGTSTLKYITEPTNMYVQVVYTDGTTQNFTSGLDFVVRKDKTLNVTFEFTPQKDVQQIVYHFYVKNMNTVIPAADDIILTFYSGEYNGDNKYQFSFEVSSEEAGLLKGIIEWLKGIKEGITNLFNSIAELPQKIWSFIENGLKSLFVPSEDFIVQYKSDMDTMLSQKLGAVYQVTSILTDGWDRITANDMQNTIDIPVVTIPLPNNNSFSFGGYTVQIVPNGFEFLVTVLKTVVGIVCTILCVNALRKKYDEVMGVEQ